MKNKVLALLETAKLRGADYSDVRWLQGQTEELVVKNGVLSQAEMHNTHGVGVRVLKNGAWGFASTDRLDQESLDRTAGL